MRICSVCLLEKGLEFFPFRTDRKIYRKQCKECLSKLNSLRYYRNHQINREKQRLYYKNNKEKYLASCKKYYKATINKQREYRKKYQKLNSLKHCHQTKKYRDKHKGLYKFYLRTRQINKLKATPKWCNLKLIKEFYINCPNEQTVDHIIPIQSKYVCGLNVPWNLQYLSGRENSKKNNKFDYTYDNNSWRES